LLEFEELDFKFVKLVRLFILTVELLALVIDLLDNFILFNT